MNQYDQAVKVKKEMVVKKKRIPIAAVTQSPTDLTESTLTPVELVQRHM